MNGGYWIVVDGPNGTGKSGTMKAVAERLRETGFDVVETREPGGSTLAEAIRGLVLDPAYEMDSITQLLLFNAARRAHLTQTILPALEAGKIVLCDRYLASSLVFQSLNPDGSPNLDDETILEAHRKYCDNLMPNLSIYLDAPLDVRRARIAGRSSVAAVTDRFEEYDDAFDIAAAEKFNRCGTMIDSDHVIIDSTGTPDEVIDITLNAILARLCNPRFGAMYWSETLARWLTITNPDRPGRPPLTSADPDSLALKAEDITNGDLDIKIVPEDDLPLPLPRAA